MNQVTSVEQSRALCAAGAPTIDASMSWRVGAAGWRLTVREARRVGANCVPAFTVDDLLAIVQRATYGIHDVDALQLVRARNGEWRLQAWVLMRATRTAQRVVLRDTTFMAVVLRGVFWVLEHGALEPIHPAGRKPKPRSSAERLKTAPTAAQKRRR